MTKLESGRSMVEMLGVLAIIGVLSIGGIAGYTMAMNRNTANNIADTAAKLSVIAYAKGQSTGGSVNMNLTDAGLGNVSGVSSMYADNQGVVTIEGAENKVLDILDQQGAFNKSSNQFNFGNN